MVYLDRQKSLWRRIMRVIHRVPDKITTRSRHVHDSRERVVNESTLQTSPWVKY
jgi:hypothetical protein